MCKVKSASLVEGDPKIPLSIVTTPRCSEGIYSILVLLHFTLDPYLIMLCIKQGDIEYHFMSLWYNSIWDCTPVSRTIGEHSNHYTNGPIFICNYVFIASFVCYFFNINHCDLQEYEEFNKMKVQGFHYYRQFKGTTFVSIS